MASVLSRFTTFVPNATILSNDHNQEFNRIVNLLNGTTTNLKTVLKTSDVGDPPLELDQLSTGPLFEMYQGGILKASFANDGSLSAASALLTGNVAINNANPSITFDDTAGTDAKIHHDASVLRFGSASVDHISLDVGTGVATFAQIPVLSAGATVGAGGTTIKAVKFGSVSIDPGNIAALTSSNPTVTVTGARAGDRFFMIPPDNLNNNLVCRSAFVPADDTLAVNILNVNAGLDVDDGSRSWNFLWFDLT